MPDPLSISILADRARADLQGDPAGPDIYSVPCLLGGLAVENLLKGRLIATGQPPIKNGRFTLDTHNLPELARKGAVDLTAEEWTLLERLQQFVRWGGRYPIPREVEAMRPREFPDGGVRPLTSGWALKDYEDIAKLIAELRGFFPPINYRAPDFLPAAATEPGTGAPS
jgi:hypothetical protein